MTQGAEAGLLAVKAKYGADIAQRMRNWPLIAAEYAKAYDGDEGAEVTKAEKSLARAKTDPAWALDQAEMIARQGYAAEDLLSVPSASLMRKRQEAADARSAETMASYRRDKAKGLLR